VKLYVSPKFKGKNLLAIRKVGSRPIYVRIVANDRLIGIGEIMYPDTSIESSLQTVDPRVQAMTDALARLDNPDVDFRWAVVVDYNGLMLSSYPEDLDSGFDEAIASTAHIMRLGESAQKEVEFGKWRFTMITGSEMQQLVLHINNEVALTVGMGSKTPLHKFFANVRDIVPDMVRALDLTSRRFTEPNTLLMKTDELERMLKH
jgi:predicted regulator of Ras-like GTPase activity (Roadblock/LC7/MglB family)